MSIDQNAIADNPFYGMSMNQLKEVDYGQLSDFERAQFDERQENLRTLVLSVVADLKPSYSLPPIPVFEIEWVKQSGADAFLSDQEAFLKAIRESFPGGPE